MYCVNITLYFRRLLHPCAIGAHHFTLRHHLTQDLPCFSHSVKNECRCPRKNLDSSAYPSGSFFPPWENGCLHPREKAHTLRVCGRDRQRSCRDTPLCRSLAHPPSRPPAPRTTITICPRKKRGRKKAPPKRGWRVRGVSVPGCQPGET